MSVSPATNHGSSLRVPARCCVCGAATTATRQNLSRAFCDPHRAENEREHWRKYARSDRGKAMRAAQMRRRRALAREQKLAHLVKTDDGRYIIPCSTCPAEFPVTAYAAARGTTLYCPDCRRARDRASNAASYARQRAAAEQYVAFAPEPERPAKKQRDSSQRGHYYKSPLTLMHDCGDFRRGNMLAMASWEQVIKDDSECGEMAGAEWQDDTGARWRVRDGKVVKA